MSLAQRLEEARTGFGRPFWVANISEIFERLAYYGAFASLANYLRETLSFPTEQTGNFSVAGLGDFVSQAVRGRNDCARVQ